MKAFADLFRRLDETNKTTAKLEALDEFFREAPAQDRMWMLALFSGRRPRRIVSSGKLAQWAADEAGIPLWLFEESYHIAGDLAETISLLLPVAKAPKEFSLTEWITRIREWAGVSETGLKQQLRQAWDELPDADRLPFHKLLTGGMRLGVSRSLVFKGLAQSIGVEPAQVALRLSGAWHPDDYTWDELLNPTRDSNQQQPYPFFLAHALEEGPESLSGLPADWFAEWKWDGIRAQLLHHSHTVQLWSRGEELITYAFPEFQLLSDRLPDGCVLDAELLAFKLGKPMDFQDLQARLGRKSASNALIRRVPTLLMAYDLLELEGRDLRQEPLMTRRNLLGHLVEAVQMPGLLRLSPEVPFTQWQDLRIARQSSRDQGSEGLMIKRKSSPYGVGRKRGDWFKWKVDPFTIDAVLLYAQRGHGRRAGLYTDFTFGIWKGEELLPFTKAYSGLTDEEVRQLNTWIKGNTLHRTGPVVMLQQDLVFEIAFEGIARSTRHRSGIALRFPRIHRWRKDKPAVEANCLEDLNSLLHQVSDRLQPPETGDLFKDQR